MASLLQSSCCNHCWFELTCVYVSESVKLNFFCPKLRMSFLWLEVLLFFFFYPFHSDKNTVHKYSRFNKSGHKISSRLPVTYFLLLLSSFPAVCFSAAADTQTVAPLQRSNRSVMRWAELRPRCCWPLCGQPAAAVPGGGGDGGIRPVYSPPIINTAGRPPPTPLLLFTTVVYCCLRSAPAYRPHL